MAESTLSVVLADLQKEVAFFLGWGRDATNYAAEQLELINACISDGLRQFYLPPRLQNQTRPHRWTFLRPVLSLVTTAPYSAGTVAVTQGDATVTLTDGAWPSWADEGELILDGMAYGIASRTSDSEIELDNVWAGASASGKSYSLERFAYDLPDGFGSLADPYLTFAETSGVGGTIVATGESRIRQLRQGGASHGRPQEAAVRPQQSSGASGQRFELLLYPTPDLAYTVEYRCRLNPNALSASNPTSTYPLGGMGASDALMASCLAAAEFKVNNQRGEQWARFLERLEAAVEADLENVPRYLGQNTDPSTRSGPSWETPRRTTLTYNGIEYH